MDRENFITTIGVAAGGALTGFQRPESIKFADRQLVLPFSSATEGINIILNGLPLQRGDEIITTTHEHVALHIPLLNQIKRCGLVIKYFEPDSEVGLNNVKKISDLLSKKTRLVFLSHRTTTTGQLLPVKEIGELLRSKNIWFAIDG